MKLLLPVIFLSASTFGLICQKPGKCVNSRWIIPNKKVETPHECLVSCQDTNHCTWASYWPATNGRWCYHYRDCTTLAATDYPQCITGHVKCATCGIVGQCKGLVLENMHALTINECLNHCKQNHQCQFFSYLSAQQDCIIFSLCAEVDEKEEEFRSGHKECDLQTSTSTSTSTTTVSTTTPSRTINGKFLVATGFPKNASVKTEVIDLADESTTCEELEEYPIQVAYASGGLINESLPLVCGGGDYGPSRIGACYIAGSAASDPMVKLLTPRGQSAAVALNSHQLWVTGGLDGYSILASTEIVDILANPPTVVQGPELPAPMKTHCIVQLNASTVLFMGGVPDYKKTFFFDIPSQTWTNGPDMNQDRARFGCGLMTIGNDLLVVASGGYESPSTTEILNVDDPNGLKWSAGPDLPKPQAGHQMVSVDGTVVSIGGWGNGDYSNAIFHLVCSALDECQWAEMAQKLAVARSHFVAMVIPDEMANCIAKVKTCPNHYGSSNWWDVIMLKILT